MTPDEILALLQVIARQQQQITALEHALRQAQAQPAPRDARPCSDCGQPGVFAQGHCLSCGTPTP